MKIKDESLRLPSTVALPFQLALLKLDGIQQTACRAKKEFDFDLGRKKVFQGLPLLAPAARRG
eukprot:COSAG05_NODE_1874_length_3915_cov_3.202306_3_plen_63_part_00